MFFGWLPLVLYERNFNYIKFRNFLTSTFNSQVPNDKDSNVTFEYIRNSHTVRSVFYIIMNLHMLIYIEMLFAMSFETERGNHYKIRCCEINKKNVQKKHIIYM
jgi:hypothetical protein